MKYTKLSLILCTYSIPVLVVAVPPTALTFMDMPPKVEEVKVQKKERLITINTKITDSMLSYSYLGMSYKPDFKLQVNNQEIKCNDSKKIPVSENKMKVRYDYNFSGVKKGIKEVIFEVPQNVDSLDITFSWDNRWRVIANKAKPKKIKVVA